MAQMLVLWTLSPSNQATAPIDLDPGIRRDERVIFRIEKPLIRRPRRHLLPQGEKGDVSAIYFMILNESRKAATSLLLMSGDWAMT